MKRTAEDSYGHVLKYTGIFGGVQGLNIMISLVRNKLIALLLGPEGMGLASLFNTTVSFVSQATNFGISFSAVKHVSELFDAGDEDRIRHFICVVRLWSLLTALLGMVVCVLVGPLLSSYTFSWGDHTLHFVMLAPAVALLAVTGGETAILKGARQLRSLAVIQIYSVFAALVVSVPLYYWFGQSAIVPVIVLMALASMLLTVAHSYRLYPLQLYRDSGLLGEGVAMVKLGVAFVLAGVLGSGAEMLIRAYLNNVADLDAVGLYNFGFMLTMTYGGMVFSAMETDYFPRLSGVNGDREAYNTMINKQALVSLLIISPIAIGMVFALPVIIPLLTSNDFLPVTDMARIAALSLYLRAVNLPIEYLSLAKGDAKSYLFLEGMYDTMIVLLIIVGYHYFGLEGTGYALTFAALGNTLLVLLYMGLRFGVRLNGLLTGCLIVQSAIGIAAVLLAENTSGMGYVAAGALLFAVSLFISVSVLRQRSSLWEKLVRKFIDKIWLK